MRRKWSVHLETMENVTEDLLKDNEDTFTWNVCDIHTKESDKI